MNTSIEDMNFNEALGVARQLRKHYRAFEKIGEVCAQGLALQVSLKDGLVKKASLEQEIVALKQERDKASESFISMKEEQEKAQRDLKEELVTLQEEKEELFISTEKERKKAQKELDEIKAGVAEFKEKFA